MDIQRIRNLTTLRVHTQIEHFFEDIKYITGDSRVIPYHLEMTCDAMRPWLMEKLKDKRFFDGRYDKTHTGEIDLSPMTVVERETFLKLFLEQPSPLEKILTVKN